MFVKRVRSLPQLSLGEVIHSRGRDEVQVRYSDAKEFKAFAKKFKIMSDMRVSHMLCCI